MSKEIRRGLWVVSLSFGMLAIVIVANQLIQFAQFARALHPVAGDLVSIGLVVLVGIVIATPLILIVRLPRPLVPPDATDLAAVEVHLTQLRQRLSGNRYFTTPIDLSERVGVEAAIRQLDVQADRLTKRAASAIFVSTAISQNGRLDTLMVLAAQTRLVWQIAHLYQQRPHWRDMLSLYNNVAVTALLVSEIEDLEISEQLEPIVASVLGSGVVGVLPGIGSLALNILTDSLLEGTANAFLTLRIGSVAKQYCGALTKLEKRAVRRSASVAAAALLGGIVRESAGVVTKAIVSAVSDVSTRGAAAAKGGLANRWQKLVGRGW